MRVADCEAVHPGIRRRARKLLELGLMTRPILDHETTLDDHLRKRLVELVLPDVAELRRWMGPSFTGWGLLTPERPVLIAS
jgi:hypothetical protein